MATVEKMYEHITLNKNGKPVIAGTRMKVLQLGLDKIAYGWSPEEMQHQYPFLTLGQIYAALAYFADHEAEFEEEIARQLKEADKARKKTLQSPMRKRLRAKGLL